jgi:hypothetical protein
MDSWNLAEKILQRECNPMIDRQCPLNHEKLAIIRLMPLTLLGQILVITEKLTIAEKI